MVELKTLKDFEYLIKNKESHHIFLSIKAEAVKWVKVLKEMDAFDRIQELDIGLPEDFIIHFFNLTEEDLR